MLKFGCQMAATQVHSDLALYRTTTFFERTNFRFLCIRSELASKSSPLTTNPVIFSGKICKENNMGITVKLLDLEKHFAFYGAYHSNPINIAIHMLFVWPIFFTAILILYFTPPLFHLPHIDFSLFGSHVALVLNFGFLFALIYAVFYVCLDVKAGTLAALLCGVCWIGSSFLATRLGFSLAWKVVLVVQLVCWAGQFIGHGVFEKRAPALLDNLVQALIMAPFFVLLEALQTFFGYEPYPGFHAIVQTKIEAQINDWQEKKQNLIS